MKVFYLNEHWVKQVGEEIVLATTDFESFHTEILTIEAVSVNGSILTVTPTQYRHIGESVTCITDYIGLSKSFFLIIALIIITTTVVGELLQRGSYSVELSAEVGLLTRNIRIIGEDYPDLISQSFGARVLVGKYSQDGNDYVGKLT